MAFDRIKVDFEKTGLDNVKELLVEAGYPRGELDKVKIYTNKKVDEAGKTELYVGVSDAEFASRMTNAGVDASTVPNASNDTAGTTKAGFVKILRHNYQRIDPMAARGLVKATDSDENGNYVNMTSTDVTGISNVARSLTLSGNKKVFLEEVTVSHPAGQTSAQYGLNQYGYAYTEEGGYTFVKKNAAATVPVRLRADTTRGNQVILFPKVFATPNALVDPTRPMAAFETKNATLDPAAKLANIYLSGKTTKTGGNAKPNEVFGISVELGDVTDIEKLKEAYFSKAYSDVPARQTVAKTLTFKAGEVVAQTAEFGSKLIATADNLVKFETNADLNENTSKVEANVGFYVVPMRSQEVANVLLNEYESPVWNQHSSIEQSLGDRAKDVSFLFTMKDRDQTNESVVPDVNTEEGRAQAKTNFESFINEHFIGSKKGLKLVYQDPANGGVTYDKDSITFKLVAAEGYENFVDGAVYLVGEYQVGKFKVSEDLDGFGEVQL